MDSIAWGTWGVTLLFPLLCHCSGYSLIVYFFQSLVCNNMGFSISSTPIPYTHVLFLAGNTGEVQETVIKIKFTKSD